MRRVVPVAIFLSRAVFWTWAGTSLLGCGVFRDDAAALLARGRTVEALELLEDDESAAAEWSGERRARYALYRGLAHLALGDAPATDRWLGEAKRRFDDDPRCLSDADAGRLLDAWATLGRGR